MSSYSTDYSRFKDIVDSDDSDEEKPGEGEEEEAAAADDAASASCSDSDSLPDLLEGEEAEDPAVEEMGSVVTDGLADGAVFLMDAYGKGFKFVIGAVGDPL